jgi:hypothetical protein
VEVAVVYPEEEAEEAAIPLPAYLSQVDKMDKERS